MLKYCAICLHQLTYYYSVFCSCPDARKTKQCLHSIYVQLPPRHGLAGLNDPVGSVPSSTLQQAAEVMHNPTKSPQLMNFKWQGLITGQL